MKQASKIETNAALLLAELENSIMKGYLVSSSVILQMNNLKKAIDEENAQLDKDITNLYNRLNKDPQRAKETK